MASVAKTTKLVDSVVRLRRAERVPGAAEDVAPVRRDLESQLGPTLSRSRASRILGVSQTALDRWVAAGQIPIVVTPRGRREVPRQVAIELKESIERLKRSGITRHPLAAVLAERRDAAGKIAAARDSVGRRKRAPLGHETAERRSLAYHEAVARRLDDQLIAEARERVDRLGGEGHLHPRYARRWREILALPIERVVEAITADDQEARDLRQNSPFAGVLNEHERRRIIETVR
jgi:DNA-binding transcriptional MerR regulator